MGAFIIRIGFRASGSDGRLEWALGQNVVEIQ